MLRKSVWVLILVCAAGALPACSTVHGVGKDIKKGGEKIEEASDAVQRKME